MLFTSEAIKPETQNKMKNKITSLTDNEIQQMLEQLSEDSGDCSCAIAEIDSEAGIYGDSAPGSGDKRIGLNESIVWIRSEIERFSAEWDRRYPVVKMTEIQVEAFSEEVPF